MECSRSNHKHYTVLAFSGDIDLSVSPQMRTHILGAIKKSEHLLIDLSAVDYIDSSGVASLVEGLQTARAQQLEFALVGLSHSAMQVLQLSRLDTVFTIYPSIDEVSG